MTVCECVGGEGLSCLMRLKARDHKSWQGGMPDLVLFCGEFDYDDVQCSAQANHPAPWPVRIAGSVDVIVLPTLRREQLLATY